MADAVRRAVENVESEGTDQLNMMFYRGIAPAPKAIDEALVEDADQMFKDLDRK